MTGSAAPPGPAPGPLLQRMAGELHLCARLLAGLETEVSALLPSLPAGDAARLHAVQDIDLLGQMLADLAACLAQLGAGGFVQPAETGWADEALARLRLDDLRGRLAGHALPPGLPGAVELF